MIISSTPLAAVERNHVNGGLQQYPIRIHIVMDAGFGGAGRPVGGVQPHIFTTQETAGDVVVLNYAQGD